MSLMDSVIVFIMAALSPLKAMILMLVAHGPYILAGLLLLVMGVFLAHWVRHGVERFLTVVKIDDHSRKLGLSNILNRLGLGSSLTKLGGFVGHALVSLSGHPFAECRVFRPILGHVAVVELGPVGD